MPCPALAARDRGQRALRLAFLLISLSISAGLALGCQGPPAAPRDAAQTAPSNAEQPPSDAAASAGRRDATPRSHRFESEEFNFAISPPAGWVAFDAARLNPLAQVAYVHSEPPTFSLIVAEKIGVSSALEAEDVAKLVRANLEASATDIKLHSMEPHRAGQLAGHLILASARLNQELFHYSAWITVQNGIAYQLYTWASARGSKREALLARADAVAASFAILDPNRPAPAGIGALEPYRSERFGYSVTPPSTRWSAWPSLDVDQPVAEFGAIYSNSGAAIVIPVSLLGTEPSEDAVVASLLSLLEFDVPDAERRIQANGLAGRELEFRATRDGKTFRYRARVLHSDREAYLALAWSLDGEDARGAFAILDAIEFAPGTAGVPAPETLSEPERTRHARVFTQLGAYYFERNQIPRSLEHLEIADRLAHDATSLQTLAQVQLRAARYADALRVIQGREDALEDRPVLLAYRAFALTQTGEPGRAMVDYERAFAAGLRDAELFEAYLELLWSQDLRDQTLARLEREIAETGAMDLRRLHASFERRAGNLERAEAELRELLELRPGDTELLYELVEAQYEARDHTGAIATSERLIETDDGSLGAYYLKGRSEYELGWFKQAKSSFETALERDPSSQPTRDFLDHVSRMIGEGANTAVKEAIEPVPLPEALALDRNASLGKAERGDYGAYYVYRVRGIHFERGREQRTTERWKAVVIDHRGVERLSSLEIPFDPLYSQIYVNELVVRDASGKPVPSTDAADFYLLDAPDAEMATSQKTLHIPVRGLQPGSTVEMTLTRRDLSPPERFTFVDYTFSRSVPAIRSDFYVTGDVDDLAVWASDGVQSRRSGSLLMWTTRLPTPYRWEPYQQPYPKFLPGLRIGSRADTWRTLGEEYLAEIETTLRPEKKLAAIAARETQGATSIEEKEQALRRYTRSLLTYKAIEFGRRARIPNAASKTLENRYGDCKDHALLLHQLLGLAGIRSHLALVGLQRHVQPDVASLDQFDHMIVYCEECRRGGTFIDATDKDMTLHDSVPRNLAGTPALILDPAGPRLETIPAYRSENHFIESDRTITLTDAGSALVDESLLLGGYAGAAVRGILKSVDRTQWEEALRESLLREADAVTIRTLQVEHLRDSEHPLTLRMQYEMRRRFTATAGGLVGRVPSLWERTFLGVAPAENRETPFTMPFPLRFSSRVRLEPPSRYRLSGLSETVGNAQAGAFADWEASVASAGSGVVVASQIARRSGDYPPAAYADILRELERAFSALEAPVEFERMDSPPRH